MSLSPRGQNSLYSKQIPLRQKMIIFNLDTPTSRSIRGKIRLSTTANATPDAQPITININLKKVEEEKEEDEEEEEEEDFCALDRGISPWLRTQSCRGLYL